MPTPPDFKTRAMTQAERAVGQPLEEYLDEQYRTNTQQQIADALTERGVKVSQFTVSRWLEACKIEARYQGQRPPEAATA